MKLTFNSLDKINYINIGLMLISLCLSIVLPFEILLLSYAILGPLHYLTEISWLKDRNFFLKKQSDRIWVYLLSAFILLGSASFINSHYLKIFQQWNLIALYILFVTIMVFMLFEHPFLRMIGIFFAILGSMVFVYNHFLVILLAIYLTTLIHVYVFTGAFILSGSLKSKSFSGYLSFVIFIACPILCFVILPGLSHPASAWSMASYTSTFTILNHTTLEQFFGYNSAAFIDIFHHPVSILITRFMAFAYTYHYLNWFSKTSVIKWHKISQKRFAVILAFWIGSLALYKVDFMLAYKWLFLLSYLHVLLEFPLNHLSFIQIGQGLKERLKTFSLLPRSG
jgi:hypothetical protein